MKKPLWTPSINLIENSNILKFIKWTNKKYRKSFKSYNELYDWSVDNIEDFWASIWEFSKIKYSKKYDAFLSGDKMFGAKWFEGTKLNFAENLLRYSDNRKAIISIREDSPNVILSYKELNFNVAKVAYSLRKLGIKKDDRVAGFVTNIPEAVIAMLAATSIGAIWTSCSPDFGINSIFDRFNQIKPKILFAIEEYQYNGKKIDCKPKIKEIKKRIRSLGKVILIPKLYEFNRENINKEPSQAKSTNYLYCNGKRRSV